MAPPLSVPGPYKSHMQLTLQLLELEPNLLKSETRKRIQMHPVYVNLQSVFLFSAFLQVLR